MTEPVAVELPPLHCPSCGRERPTQAEDSPVVDGSLAAGTDLRSVAHQECPFCGVVYARFRSRTARRPEPEPSGTAALVVRPLKAPHLSLAERESLLLALAQSLEAGLTVEQHARGPALHTFPPAVVEILGTAGRDGRLLATALAELRILHPAGLALVRAGETQGRIAGALRVLANRIGERRAAHRRLAALVAYPLTMLVLSILIQPVSALVLEGFGAYLGAVLPPLGVVLTVLGLVLVVVPRLPPDARFLVPVRRVAAVLPPFAWVMRERALETFARTLSDCITAGLPMRLGLSLAAEATGHHAFERAQTLVLADLDTGATLEAALARISVLPPEARALIGHGENVGRLDEVLPRLADEHGRRAKSGTIGLVIGAGVVVLAGVLLYLVHAVIAGFTSYLGTLESSIDAIFR